jgi:UDP-N-acetylglucosamine acyltransferase
VDNYISPSAQLIGDVQIGSGNFIGDNCRIYGPISIGSNNHFAPSVIVGLAGQDESLGKDFHDEIAFGGSSPSTGLIIGNNNIFREFSSIHRGISGMTFVGSGIYLMSYANISHDSEIHDGVKIASNVQMGGYTTICKGAYIGMSATIHQFSVIGAYCMVGMGSVVTRDISTASKAFGNPCRNVGPNVIALKKMGITEFGWWEKKDFNQADVVWHTNLRIEDSLYLDALEKRAREKARIRELRSGSQVTKD